MDEATQIRIICIVTTLSILSAILIHGCKARKSDLQNCSNTNSVIQDKGVAKTISIF